MRRILAVMTVSVFALMAIHSSAGASPAAVAEVFDGVWRSDGAFALQGETLEFTAINSQGDGINYTWDMDSLEDSDDNGFFNDDVDAVGPNVTWTYYEMGLHNVTLRTKNSTGNDTDRLWVNISYNHEPEIILKTRGVLVGETINVFSMLDFSDEDRTPVTIRVDIDHRTDTNGDGTYNNDRDFVWSTGDNKEIYHRYTKQGAVSVHVNITDGYHMESSSSSFTISPAGTEIEPGKRYSNTDTVLRYGYTAYKLDMGEGDILKIIFRAVTGTSRPRFLTFNTREFTRFRNYQNRANATYIDELSHPGGTRSLIDEWTSDSDGEIVIVIENGYLSVNDTVGVERLKYIVTFEIDRKRDTPGFDAVIVIIAMIPALMAFSRKFGKR